jgi:hypothetical protein
MATNDSDQELVNRILPLIEDIKKKVYDEAFNAGRQVGWRDAQAAWEFAETRYATFFEKLIEEGMPVPVAQESKRRAKPPSPSQDNVDPVDAAETVIAVARAIAARASGDLPMGVAPDDLADFPDARRVRQAFRQLLVQGRIRRVERGRYLPVAEAQTSAAAE